MPNSARIALAYAAALQLAGRSCQLIAATAPGNRECAEVRLEATR